MPKVLIVDDQPAVRRALELLFEIHHIAAISVASPASVPELLTREDFGLVIQDMNFHQQRTDGAEGVALFRTIKQLDPDLPVLLMTVWTSLESAVSLIQEGAADYFAKPWNDEKLVRSVRNLMRLRELAEDNQRLHAQAARARRQLAGKADLCGLVYTSQAMHEVVSLAVSVAASDAPVLIGGPNGSGKEKLAEIVQANSRRAGQPFVKVNLGGLPADLLEAELFGAEPGAFTGATKLRVGRFEAADGGTLFLDELGNLPLAGQAKLLRVLQTGEYERLGSSSTRRVDARLISATNADLPRAIAERRFREDLFYRLNVIELFVPPLAERAEDVLPLAEHFLASHETGGAARTFSDEARAALVAHEWPGNVRELQNRVRRATLVGHGATITPAELGLAAARPDRPPGEPTASGPAAPAPPAIALEPANEPDSDEVVGAQRAQLEDALARAGGVVSKAAAELGLSRQALYRRMERLGIAIERRVKPT